MASTSTRSLLRFLPQGLTLAFLIGALGLTLPIPAGRAQTSGPELDPVTHLPIATPRVIPIQEDPNDPKASRAERIRRQQVRLQNQIKEAQARKQAQKEGKPVPTPAPDRGADTIPPQPDPNAPNAAAVQAGVAQPAHTPPAGAPSAQGAPVHSTEPSGLGVSSAARKPFTSFVMDPASAVLKVGERFATTCRLANPDHLPIDRIHIMLDYPERSLKPIAIHTDRLEAIQKDEPIIALERGIGVLACSAELQEPSNLLQIDLITIEWEAIAPTERATIEPFLADDYSGAFYGEQRQTESVLGLDEAVTGASVRINPAPTEIPLGMKMADFSLDQLQTQMGNLKDQSTLAPPTLWIDEQSSGVLEAGDWLVVDFGLSNPSKMIFDEVRLACRYDPTAIEIIDADRENMKVKGTNLLDGLFHELWHWDTATTNHVNNKSGVFYYRSSTQDLREMPSGIVARAICRVIKPVEGPVFTWLWNAKAPAEEPQTGIYLAGRNVYLRAKGEPEPGQPGSAGAIPVGKDSYMWGGVEKANPNVYKF